LSRSEPIVLGDVEPFTLRVTDDDDLWAQASMTVKVR